MHRQRPDRRGALCRLRFRQRSVEAEGGSIRPMRSDRLGDVSDGKHARLDDNSLPGQAPGITRAIKPLMMLKHGLGDRPGELDALDDVVACLRMGPDKLDFEGDQLSWLAKDFGRNVDLAMSSINPARKCQRMVFRQPHLSGDHGASFATRR